jgi:hypothetical protein
MQPPFIQLYFTPAIHDNESMVLNLDELKIQFVISVYDSITRQIQHTDIKTSILISWDGVMAVMLGREIVAIASNRQLGLSVTLIALAVGAALFASGIYVFQILRPRSPTVDAGIKGAPERGLLYAGDILNLGRTPSDRIQSYLTILTGLNDAPEIYAQYIKSIILIADVSRNKNKMFLKALLASTVAFSLLAFLIALVGIRLGGI